MEIIILSLFTKQGGWKKRDNSCEKASKIRQDHINQDGKSITLKAFSLFSLSVGLSPSLVFLEGFVSLQGFSSFPGNLTKVPKNWS